MDVNFSKKNYDGSARSYNRPALAMRPSPETAKSRLLMLKVYFNKGRASAGTVRSIYLILVIKLLFIATGASIQHFAIKCNFCEFLARL